MTSRPRLLNIFAKAAMDLSRSIVSTELLESVVHQLIDEETLGVSLEMHRAINLGYYELLYPNDSVYEKHEIVDVNGLDIFGNPPQAKKNVECVCPACERTLGAQKFAPHLEKCMGMGRNSSRLAATKKPKTPVDSDPDISDDNEDEWTYPERKANKRLKKDKLMSNSPRRGSGRGPGRPPKNPKPLPPPPAAESAPDTGTGSSESQFLNLKPSLQQHNVASFAALPIDYKQSLLQQICGVVSERTGRLCTRSPNCPQHTEDQRQDVRRQLLCEPVDLASPSPAKRVRESPHQAPSEASDDLAEVPFDPGPTHHPTDNLVRKKKKMKSGKRPKKGGSGHEIVTTTTLLHSSGGNMF